MEKATITLPEGLRERAHANGINVSAVAAAALLRSVQALEKDDTGALSSKTSAPAVSSQGVTS